MTPTTPSTEASLSFRPPTLADGAPVFELVRATGKLDANSAYAYLMWCDHFADQSVVVEFDGKVCAFLLGFHPPREPTVLFVWQVAVDVALRGRRVGLRMLASLLERIPRIGFVEATVTPSNEPSARLFRSLARRSRAPISESEKLRAEDFPAAPFHEPETLFRIGPIDANGRSQLRTIL